MYCFCNKNENLTSILMCKILYISISFKFRSFLSLLCENTHLCSDCTINPWENQSLIRQQLSMELVLSSAYTSHERLVRLLQIKLAVLSIVSGNSNHSNNNKKKGDTFKSNFRPLHRSILIGISRLLQSIEKIFIELNGSELLSQSNHGLLKSN